MIELVKKAGAVELVAPVKTIGVDKTYVDTEVNKVKQYSNNTFANAVKGAASGEIVSITDASPVEHTVSVELKRKNLFNKYNLYSTTIGYEYRTGLLEDGTIYVPKNAVGSGKTLKELAPELEAGKTYVMNYETTGTSKYIYLGSSQKVWKCGSALTLTQNDIDSKVSFYSDADVQTNSAIITNFQIERGSIATSYAPYIEDIEQVKIVAQGANLVDNNKFFNIDYWLNCGDYGCPHFRNGWFALNVVSGQTYTISYSGVFEHQAEIITQEKGVLEYDTTKNLCYLFLSGDSVNKFTFTADETKDYYIFLSNVFNSGVNAFGTVNNFQLELGNTATEYEEYKEPTEYEQGQAIQPIYPTTTIGTDTDGAIVETEYNKDINKAFAELTSALISLGANV